MAATTSSSTSTATSAAISAAISAAKISGEKVLSWEDIELYQSEQQLKLEEMAKKAAQAVEGLTKLVESYPSGMSIEAILEHGKQVTKERAIALDLTTQEAGLKGRIAACEDLKNMIFGSHSSQ